jgi:hypothetical protein
VRHVQGRLGRTDGADFDAASGRRQREHPCPAADVEDLPRPGLLRHARVRGEVATVGVVELVVHRGELRMP